MKEINGVMTTRIEHYVGMVPPPWVKHMRTFGEDGTVRTDKDDKVGNRGVIRIFLGYAEKHKENCYQLFNPHRSSVVETCDVTWVKPHIL